MFIEGGACTHRYHPPPWSAVCNNPQGGLLSQPQHRDRLSESTKIWTLITVFLFIFFSRCIQYVLDHPHQIRFTSPLSPSMESLGLGSCWPLMIFRINWVFLCPGSGSSNIGLKAPGGNFRSLAKDSERYSKNCGQKCACVHTFNHPLGLQNVSTVPVGRELGLVEFKHATLSLIIHGD